jgi:hypothetical protein
MLLLLSIVLVAVLVILVILLFLLRAVERLPGTAGGGGGGTAGPPGPGIPGQIEGSDVAGYLAVRLAGTPADGSPPRSANLSSVVWVDSGDEVLVHLDSITTQIAQQSLLVSIDLECDQTGRTPLVVAFALPPDDSAGLVVATDEYPRGNGLLAARWGAAVQAAAWSALLSLASDHAAQQGQAPRGLTATGGKLHLIVGQPLRAG